MVETVKRNHAEYDQNQTNGNEVSQVADISSALNF